MKIGQNDCKKTITLKIPTPIDPSSAFGLRNLLQTHHSFFLSISLLIPIFLGYFLLVQKPLTTTTIFTQQTINKINKKKSCIFFLGFVIVKPLNSIQSIITIIIMATTITSTNPKCKACDKTVYLVDKLTADNKVFHKACFRCHHCKGTLKVLFIFPNFLFLFIMFSHVYLRDQPIFQQQV